METLIKRFDNIIKFSSMTYLTADKCAEECKQVAIEFETWVNKYFMRWPGTEEYCKVTNNPDEWPKNFSRVGREELFTKFLEEYGK